MPCTVPYCAVLCCAVVYVLYVCVLCVEGGRGREGGGG